MLKKIREFTSKQPIVSCIAIAVLFFVLMNGVSLAFRLLPSSLPFRYAQEIIGMLYSVGLIFLLGFHKSFRFKGFFKGMLCSTVIILCMIYSIATFFSKATSIPDTAWASTGMIIFGLFHAIVIGVREECFFRGAIQSILAKKYANSVKGVWTTAIIASAIFGLVHMMNIITGVDPLIALAQSLSAVGSGLFFAAIYLRSGNLLVAVLIHALVDTAALSGSIFLRQTHTEVINSLSFGSLIGVVIYLLPAVFLLRPSKCREIVARFEAERKDNLAK